MVQTKTLSPEAQAECLRLYAEKGLDGKRIYSQARIAAMLDCSETTVFRCVHRLQPYADRTLVAAVADPTVAQPVTDAETKQAADESLKRLLQINKGDGQ